MIGEALRRMRGRLTLDELATHMSVHKNTLGNYERGDRLPDIDFLAEFAAVTRADLGELLTLRLRAGGHVLSDTGSGVCGIPPGRGRWAGEAQLAEPSPEYGVRQDDLVFVPPAVIGGEPAGVAFRRNWLEAQGLDPAALLAMTADDDSMTPAIRQGALVLVEVRAALGGCDGIYAIEQGGHARIRRLQSDLEGGVFIRSDNPAYRELFLSPEALAGSRILGRVVWVGGCL